MTHAPRAAVYTALLLGFAGCTSDPVTVMMLDRGKLQSPAKGAIPGPVFFMPTVRFQVTIPLDVQKTKNRDKPTLFVRPSRDPDRPIQLLPIVAADDHFPLVIQDRAGVLIDITKFEIDLDEHSVLVGFNREADDRSDDIALSALKLGLTVAGAFRAVEMPTDLEKVDIPAELVFTFSPSHLPAGTARGLDELVKSVTGLDFSDLFWNQNPALPSGEYERVTVGTVIVQRTSYGPFDRHATIAAGTWSTDAVGEILTNGVKGIPYRIPADHTIIFSISDPSGSWRTSFNVKSPDDQPLLLAPIKERRFSTASSGAKIRNSGALEHYSRTQTNAAKGAIESGLSMAEQLKADKEARAEARKQEQKKKYDLAIKLRTKMKERAGVEASIASLEATLRNDPDDTEAAQLLRDKKAELDILNIKIQALIEGIDLS